MRLRLFALIAVAAVVVQPAFAHTPESREVRAIVDKAVAWLRTAEGDSMNQFGAKALRGMAILKATRDRHDPDVQKMAAAVSQTARLPVDRLKSLEASQYSLGISLMFLCALDAQQFQAEIQNLAQALVENQKPDGSWTYVGGSHPNAHGDTSQTQYGCMALWVAVNNAEIQVDPRVFEKAMQWLMKTQKPSGAFAYQPESLSEARVSTSLTAAGAGSTLICADALGLFKEGEKSRAGGALKAVGGPKARTRVPKANVMATVGLANNYFNTNFTWANQQSYYYFLYAMERYMTFKDIAAGIEEGENPEPAWYNQGVEVLKRQQEANGSFTRSELGAQVGTSFAILFLMRATKETVDATAEGVLRSGYSLPKNVALLSEGENGEIVGLKIEGSLESVLRLLADDEVDYDALVENLDDVRIERRDVRKRDAQMEALRKWVTSGKFGDRFVAVRAMSRENSLDVVPGLIYALTDPDPRISVEARDGLRFVSRKFGGFGMPDRPSDGQKQAAQAAWTDWLKSIRPNAKLILE